MTYKPKHKYVYITYRPVAGLTPHSLDLIHEWIKSHTPSHIASTAETVEFTSSPHFTRAHWHCTIEFIVPCRCDNIGFIRKKLFPEAVTLQGLFIVYPSVEATHMRHTGYLQKEQSTLFKSTNMSESYLKKCYELYEQWELSKKAYHQRLLPDILLTRKNQMQYFRQIMNTENISLVTAITNAINSQIIVFSFIPYKLQWRMEHEAPNWTETMTITNLLEPLGYDWYCPSQAGSCVNPKCPKKRKLNAFEEMEQGVLT